MLTFSKDCKITRVISVTNGAAGTSDINSTSVDMAGWGGVIFVVQLGAITSTAVTSIHAEQSEDNSSFADLANTNQAIADDDDEEIYYIDVKNPTERYVRLVVDRGTANAVCSAIAIQYNPQNAPVSQATGVTGELHVGPSEGTI